MDAPSERHRQAGSSLICAQGVSPCSVSIIVPVVRAATPFAECLDSLARLAPPCDDLVVVVDGVDELARVMAEQHGARVVCLPTRRGPAAARNAGARIACGEVLFFVDADVTLRSDALSRVRAAFAAHAACDAVIGSYDDAPAAQNFISQYKNLAHHFVHQTSRGDAFTFWGACGAVRRTSFWRVGGFDERYTRSSVEDIELGSRLVASGGRIWLEKALQVTHLKRWDALGLLESEVRDRAVPWTRLILRNGRMPDDLNLRWSCRIAVVASCLLPPAIVITARHADGWPLVALPVLILLGVDLPFLKFLVRRRGWLFSARAFGWQWMHYLCSALGFAAGSLLHLFDGLRGRLPARSVGAPNPDDGEHA